MTPVYVVMLAMLLLLGFAFVRTRRKASRLSQLDWKVLLTTLQPVPMDNIAQIAIQYRDNNKADPRMTHADVWRMIGESEGLNRLYANSEILMALASYAAQWNPEEAYVALERMRRDAVTLRKATLRLSVGTTLGLDNAGGPFVIQEAANAYYMMRERIIELYSVAHIGRLNDLRSVL